MASPLEKARKDPDSMKAKILRSSRILFGEYGYHGLTTRMIAKDVGIDISTLHYHWGDKENLYESVIIDINDDVKLLLQNIEKVVGGKKLSYRLEFAIDQICDFLFENQEIAKLTLYSYFAKTRSDTLFDNRIAEHITNIAVSMELASSKDEISPQAIARVLAVWNSIPVFTSGKNMFMSILDVDNEKYIKVVKDTLKFILIPAFTVK